MQPLFSLEPLDDDDDNDLCLHEDHISPPQQSPPPSSCNTHNIPSTTELLQRFEASQSIAGNGSTATIAYKSSTDAVEGCGTRVIASSVTNARKGVNIELTSMDTTKIVSGTDSANNSANTTAATTKEGKDSKGGSGSDTAGSPLSLSELKRRKDEKREEFRKQHGQQTAAQ